MPPTSWTTSRFAAPPDESEWVTPSRRPALARRLGRGLFAHRGNLVWDGVLRGSAAAALIGIAVVLFAPPATVGLVGFLVVTIWVNGPIGMFLPATYEPILMVFGRLYPPLIVAAVGMAGTLYVEFLNYHLYDRLLRTKQLTVIRENPVVERLVPLFRRAPFFTVWLCAWSPLPFWAVRILAPLARYPMWRYLAATLLGRLPRLWFFAALGALPIPNRLLIPAVLIAVALAFVFVFARPLLAQVRGVLSRYRIGRARPVVSSPPEEVACGS